jgi:hypothetical protein
MNFIEVKCENRGSVISINTNKIVMLKRGLGMVNGEEACEIVIENSPSDNQGSVLVMESVEDVKRRINHPKNRNKLTVAEILTDDED